MKKLRRWNTIGKNGGGGTPMRAIILSLIICMSVAFPVQAKVEGFKETLRKKYGEEIWHTYTHSKSGLEVIWIENKDVNKAFVIGVKTPTVDNTGVNHILEHTLFTGSKKYPSSSVFFDASEAYPSTYMNALTSGDMTIFPFSTPYHTCFNELREIYLDAVFNPRLTEMPYGFYEEGFHCVPEENRYGGVVYNEMKGAYSSLDRAIYRGIRQAIYENSCYAYDSGGSPNAIPTLTYENFVETYKRYYYPANMRIIVYGDIWIEETLASIGNYVATYEKQKDVSLWEAKRDSISSEHRIERNVLPEQSSTCIVKAFVLPENTSPNDLNELELWMSAYMMNPQTYFQGTLLKEGIQAKWLKDDDLPYPVYAVVLTDVPEDKIDEYDKLLDKLFATTPKYFGKNYFLEQDILKEAKWQVSQLEESANRGIAIAQSILDGWAHHRELDQYYKIRRCLNEMTELNPKISYILFKDATPYTLILHPNTQVIEDPETLSPIDTVAWIEINKQMSMWQNQKMTLNPVDLDDLIISPNIVPKIDRKNDYWLMESLAPTSQLTRSTLYLNTAHIPQEDLPYLYLYAYLLEESAMDITPYSGTILTSCNAYPIQEGYWPCFRLTITTPKEEKEHGTLLNEARNQLMYKSRNWYQQKLTELTKGIQNAHQNNALGILAQLAIGNQDDRGAYLYQQGYPLYTLCQDLVKSHDTDWISKVKNINNCLYHTNGTILALTYPSDAYKPKDWSNLIKDWQKQPNLKGAYQFSIPSGIYTVQSDANVDYVYVSLFKPEGTTGSDYLLASYLTKNYLNTQIRVKRGAYGTAMQVYDPVTMGIYTYRDPDCQSSLPIVLGCTNYIDQKMTGESLSLSKAEALSRVHEKYKLLGTQLDQISAIEHLILWGKTPQDVVHLQQDIISTTAEGIQAKKERYEKIIHNGQIVIMTKKNIGDVTYHY